MSGMSTWPIAYAGPSMRSLNEDNIRTRDLGGTASTDEFAQAASRRVRANASKETHA